MEGGPTDEQLMLAFQAGDARAFEILVKRFRTPVFNFILRLTGHRARAEDLLQDTWLRVLRNAATYETKARFSTWVYTIARNLCVDEARKAMSSKAESPEDLDPRPSPERAAELSQLTGALERALHALPKEQREVFWLREYSGLSFKEIAQVTLAPENTVKSRMRYALEGLRCALEDSALPAETRRAAP